MSSKNRDKYSSPPPHAASVTTPPPSNSQQVPYLPARTPTPTHSHLSSPPPTIKATTKRKVMDNESLSHSSDQDVASSVPELRSMLAEAQEECRIAKTSAAHYRLQYKMLSMEAEETQNRKDVELNMLRHELNVMRRTKDTRTAPGSPDGMLTDLRNKSNFLEAENARLRHRLQDAKSYILESEATRTHETTTLRKRIRQNREHFHLLNRTGALFGEVLPHTKLHEAPHIISPPKSRTDDAFSQLLLADQVLSQGTASTPATPHAARQRGHAPHHRPAHSLTSLPSTPLRSALRTEGPYYLPGQASAQSPARSALTRRRESRDSTISASDEERVPDSHLSEVEGDEVHVEAGDDVTASRASMEAVNMLRRSASNSFHRPTNNADMRSPPSHLQSGAQMQGPMQAQLQAPTAQMSAKQSMMYGYQIRPGGGAGQESIKRRFYDEGVEKEGRARKKGRVGSGPREQERQKEGTATGEEGVGLGLGIGGWR